MPLIPNGTDAGQTTIDGEPQGPMRDNMTPPGERGLEDLATNATETLAGIQETAVLKLFGDVGMIAEKVDKMAGLTGN
jgi:hypothetical protein